MPFVISPNVAESTGVSWSNLIKRVPNTTPHAAQRIAMADPAITFFFYCRQSLVLEDEGMFSPGDAVFFSGTPRPGPAPQADIYRKELFATAYVEVNSNNFADVGCYTLPDGTEIGRQAPTASRISPALRTVANSPCRLANETRCMRSAL